MTDALTRHRELGNRAGERDSPQTLVLAYLDAGRPQDARRCADALHRLAADQGIPLDARSTCAVAAVCRAEGDGDQAHRLYDTGLQIAAANDSASDTMHAQLGLATTSHDRGDYVAAIDLATQALDAARRTHSQVTEGRALTQLARTHHALGDTTHALDTGLLALANHQRTGHRTGEALTHLVLAQIQHNHNEQTNSD